MQIGGFDCYMCVYLVGYYGISIYFEGFTAEFDIHTLLGMQQHTVS
jgi:hypothetical protein